MVGLAEEVEFELELTGECDWVDSWMPVCIYMAIKISAKVVETVVFISFLLVSIHSIGLGR